MNKTAGKYKAIKTNSVVKKSHSICWTCLRSRPIPGIGCSWSMRFIPVTGWVAESTFINSTRKSGEIVIDSYCVCECPLYIKEQDVRGDKLMDILSLA